MTPKSCTRLSWRRVGQTKVIKSTFLNGRKRGNIVGKSKCYYRVHFFFITYLLTIQCRLNTCWPIGSLSSSLFPSSIGTGINPRAVSSAPLSIHVKIPVDLCTFSVGLSLSFKDIFHHGSCNLLLLQACPRKESFVFFILFKRIYLT